MDSYSISLRIEVVEALGALKRAERQRIWRFIESLPDDPARTGDYSERDSTGRRIEVSLVGDHAIHYWLDGPVNEFKVVDMRSADR